MKQKLFIIALVACAVMLPTSCTLHQEPELTAEGERGVDPTQVMLNAELSLNLELPGIDPEAFTMPADVMHRFIVEAYNRDREVVRRQVLYSDNLEATSFTLPVSMRLHAAPYRIVVWSDYVSAADPESPLYYNASSLTPVILNGSYRANTNAKDTYSGYVDLDLLPYADDWNAKVSADIRLERPMGRYQLISTDVEAFKRRLAEGAVKGSTFTARIKYSGYLSVGYNCYDQIRKHSLNYMSYNTAIRLPASDPTVSLGFDYIFIAPDESLDVPVEIEVVNENNEAVSRSVIKLPLQRNMNTTVKGRFLTSTADGGLQIDPGYDGNVTVDIGTITPEK